MFDPNALIIFLSIIGFFFLWLLPLLYMAIVDAALRNKGNYTNNKGIKFLYGWARFTVDLSRSIIGFQGSARMSNVGNGEDGCILILLFPISPVLRLLLLPLMIIVLPITLFIEIIRLIISLFHS